MIWVETLLVLAVSWLAAFCLLGFDDTHHHLQQQHSKENSK